MPFGCTYSILPVDTIGVHTVVTQKAHDVRSPGTGLWSQNSKFVEKSPKSQFEILRGFSTEKLLKCNTNHDFSTAAVLKMARYEVRDCATDLKLTFGDILCNSRF